MSKNFIYTPNLQRLVEGKSEATIQWVNDTIEKRYKQLRKNREEDRKEAMRVLLRVTDEHFANSELRPTCKKGCNFCCHQNTDASMDEAALIVDYCREKGIAINRNALRNRLGVPFLELPLSRFSACVFLKEGECSIYPVRPLSCRTYFAISDPSLCDMKKYTPATFRPIIIYDRDVEIMLTAFFNLVFEEAGRLEEMLLKTIQ